jgi:hypothetical protein
LLFTSNNKGRPWAAFVVTTVICHPECSEGSACRSLTTLRHGECAIAAQIHRLTIENKLPLHWHR